MDDTWGDALPSATAGKPVEPLPPRLAALAALTGKRILAPDERWAWPAAEELPEVRVLTDAGWRPLERAPLYWCLPAVWPAEHRCWVPDRLPKISQGFDGRRTWLEPWDMAMRQSTYADLTEEAARCGLPAPPVGRLWLVRSPWASIGVQVVLWLLARRCEQRGLPDTTAGITETARELLFWPEDELWEWWSGPDADVARAWRSRGRAGEEVAGLVLAELGPREADALMGGEQGLSQEQAVAWCEAVGETGRAAVARVRAWRALGLSADPPYDPGMMLARVPPEQAVEWLAAGFGIGDIGEFGDLSLASAVRWRDSGFAPSQARRLLEADGTLTPEEAAVFDAVGIAADERLRWVEDGFDAAEARAWTDLGVLPGEARVWRSIGQGPQDARQYLLAGRGPLPPEVQVGWTAMGSLERADRRYGVTDPPGTRGRTAHQTTRGD
jgi:hypothetical protein